jgi:N-acetylglucosaminylphosphatidylinositol deacetylase
VVRGKAIYFCYHLVSVHHTRELMIGNNYGLGKTRKAEIKAACEVLGITRKDRCLVFDHTYFSLPSTIALKTSDLPDHPEEWWDTDTIAKVVEKVVKRWKIDAIITFDDYGVSGHINHRAVSAGVRYIIPPLTQTKVDVIRHYVLSTKSDLPAYQLSSVFILRKYTALLDLPLVLFFSIPRLLATMFGGDGYGSWGLMVASPSMYFTARSAFHKHTSQVVWDRYLTQKICWSNDRWIYMVLSRYMYVNELRRIHP